jgi:hypothetical protein
LGFPLRITDIEFVRDDIGTRFKLAGLAPPKNLSRDFQTAVSNGWIGKDAKTPGQFFITTKGEQAITNKFEGVRASSGRARRRRRKGAKAAKK